jgi:hypothetical protein
MAAETIKPQQTTRKPTNQQAAIITTAQQHPTLSEREIANLTNTDRAHVHRTLKTFGIRDGLVDNYVNYRAKIYQGIQARILSSITAQDIEKASLRDKCVSAGIIHDHECTELGQNTSTQPVMIIIKTESPQMVKVEGGVIDVTPAPTNAE